MHHARAKLLAVIISHDRSQGTKMTPKPGARIDGIRRCLRRVFSGVSLMRRGWSWSSWAVAQCLSAHHLIFSLGDTSRQYRWLAGYGTCASASIGRVLLRLSLQHIWQHKPTQWTLSSLRHGHQIGYGRLRPWLRTRLKFFSRPLAHSPHQLRRAQQRRAQS